MNLKTPGKKKKNVSVFSHEYIITNHGDIVSFVAMIIVIGLMFHATAPLASLFIVMHHNVTVNATAGAARGLTMYTSGRRDVFAVFFYTLISIVIHAVIQEYGLDKLNRKLHLSKVKNSKFNESGQLAVFYLVSAFWGGNILYSERYVTSLSSLWQDYPHVYLPFWVKFYFVFQICYWLHGYPELYFQKVKKDEMPARIIYTTLYLITVTLAYALNLTRFGLCLLVLHYSVEFIFHVSRLLYFANKTKVANIGYMLWNVLFVLARVATLIVAYLTFNLGLEKTSKSRVSFSEGNFNTKFIRLNCLVLISLIQVYMMWNFINFHLRRMRERAVLSKRVSPATTVGKKSTSQGKKSKREDVDISELPEVDQNQVRQRKSAKTKA